MAAQHYLNEAEIYKCKQHPSKRHRTGVCPLCLKLRLSVLCPDCATTRPCSCTTTAATTATSSSSSSASTSSSSVSTLFDAQPPLQKSRSSAFAFLRRSSTVRCDHGDDDQGRKRKKSVWSVFWSKKPTDKEMMMRSKSVSMENGMGKGTKGWYFTSPMKVFKYSKAAKFFHERSPLHRG